jgi:putative MFS transporter
MLVLRGLQGLAAGGEVPVAVTYMTEVARAKGRGRFILLYEIIFPIGLVLAAIVGWWLVSHGAWQWIFILGGIPGLVFVFMQRTLPESPRWLASRGRFREAAEVTALIERETERYTGRPLPPAVPIEVEDRQPPFWRDLFGPVYRSRTLMIWAVCLLCYLINYGIVGWLPTLYRTDFGLSVDRALGYSLVTTAAGLAGTVLCAFLIDVVGRRAWFTFAFGASAIVMTGIWLNGSTSPEFLMLGASVGHFFVSTISIGVFLYMPEIYPTRLRARGVCIAPVWSTIAGVIGPSLVGIILTDHGLPTVFMALAAVGVLGAIVAALFAVETRGRVLEEVSP